MRDLADGGCALRLPGARISETLPAAVALGGGRARGDQ